MDVSIEMPGKKLRRDVSGATLARALNGAAAGIAYALASSIKRRVSIHAKTNQGAFKYTHSKAGGRSESHQSNKGRKKKHFVSPRYPARGGTVTGSGARHYRSSIEFHAAMGTKPGSFNVNKGKGMWSGLSVMVLSLGRSRIAFRGRSEGQGMAGLHERGVKATEPHWRRTASGDIKAKPRKISNALKAGTVWHATKISLLAPSAFEMEQIARSVHAVVLSKGIKTIAGRRVEVPRIPRSKFIDIVLRAQLGPGRVR